MTEVEILKVDPYSSLQVWGHCQRSQMEHWRKVDVIAPGRTI